MVWNASSCSDSSTMVWNLSSCFVTLWGTVSNRTFFDKDSSTMKLRVSTATTVNVGLRRWLIIATRRTWFLISWIRGIYFPNFIIHYHVSYLLCSVILCYFLKQIFHKEIYKLDLSTGDCTALMERKHMFHSINVINEKMCYHTSNDMK